MTNRNPYVEQRTRTRLVRLSSPIHRQSESILRVPCGDADGDKSHLPAISRGSAPPDTSHCNFQPPTVSIAMAQSQYHLFSLPQEILDTLVPRNIANQTTAPPPPRTDSAAPAPQPTAGSRACNICLGATFVDVDDQRAHFRSDWHRYNVKIRLGGGEPVSEARFAQLVDGASGNASEITPNAHSSQAWRTRSRAPRPRPKASRKTPTPSPRSSKRPAN